MFVKFVKTFSIVAIVAVITIVSLGVTQTSTVYAASLDRWGNPIDPNNIPGNSQQNDVQANQVSYAATPLTEDEADTISQAILEEYGAYNLYQSVIDQFGSVVPFSQIVLSEQQHINALTRLAVKSGVTVPANPGIIEAPVFETLADACEAGVVAEIADAALYDDLSPLVTHTDILNVFSNLQSASLNSHLPAFEACN